MDEIGNVLNSLFIVYFLGCLIAFFITLVEARENSKLKDDKSFIEGCNFELFGTKTLMSWVTVSMFIARKFS